MSRSVGELISGLSDRAQSAVEGTNKYFSCLFLFAVSD